MTHMCVLLTSLIQSKLLTNPDFGIGTYIFCLPEDMTPLKIIILLQVRDPILETVVQFTRMVERDVYSVFFFQNWHMLITPYLLIISQIFVSFLSLCLTQQ